MFYSQFILAKKGPLGTIWIAAHLERKLRKNQVADTDIGFSVDSILFPDVPIALRLSSHLLLGVVRIYNRKVNYLFDDCSEALLKVKQAFRSTTVDLPPEESKAPYHSITLPETFDLDDFELPDNDIFHGKYNDHHISSKEQITLQDNMEGVSYSTSKFGLDERFGDGDALGLDLDEELLLEKAGSGGNANESADPQASVASLSSFNQDEHTEDRAANSEPMVGVNEYNDVMDYAEGPCTPGLVAEPNISTVQEASACEDHLESEYNLESTMKENSISKGISFEEDKQEVHWSSHDGTIPQETPGENPDQSLVLENKTASPQKESPIRDNIELEEPSSVSELSKVEAVNIELESAKDLSSVEKSGNVENVIIGQELAPDALNLTLENEIVSVTENPETEATFETSEMDLDAHDKEEPTKIPALRACTTNLKHADVSKSKSSVPIDADSDNAALESSLAKENVNQGKQDFVTGSLNQNSNENLLQEPLSVEVHNVTSDEVAVRENSTNSEQEPVANLNKLVETGSLNQNSNENQLQEPVSVEVHNVTSDEVAVRENSTNSEQEPVENLNKPVETELPAPEKLLSVLGSHADLHKDMLDEFSPSVMVEGDTGSKTVTGKKRTFTESTLTEQSLNSVESSRQVRVKRTADSVPDDDDLLSSILVGRKSSVLKLKPTPRLSEVTSMKRTRSAPRSTAPKRKLLMDDTMVLHGDMIRQQLTITEDIRRVRKKAPCTFSEISMIQKQHLEDEFFLEAVFTGMSVDLASLHSEEYDLSRITICQNKEPVFSREVLTDPVLPSHEAVDEPKLDSHDDNNNASSVAVAEQHLPSPVTENVTNSVTERIEESDKADDNNASSVPEQDLRSPVNENGTNSVTEMVEEPDKADDTEQGEVGKETELAGPSENPILSENRLGEVDCMSTEINNNQEQIKSLEVSQQELSAETSDGKVQLSSLNETGEVNLVNVDAPSVELDSGNVTIGEAIGKDGVNDKDGDVGGECETELESRNIHSDVNRDGTEHVEVQYNVNDTCSVTIEEQNMQARVLEDDTTTYGEDAMLQGFQPSTLDAEFSGFELRERDELNYSAIGHDTEFLNVDDEDLSEMADDDMPDAEETRITENSGWSSRTRAVSKYLQTLFVKEAETGRKSLSVDNLLTGKSRKEASRMFFETLVLKTRDYVHVEQWHPFDDITVKPRSKLMKSDF